MLPKGFEWGVITFVLLMRVVLPIAFVVAVVVLVVHLVRKGRRDKADGAEGKRGSGASGAAPGGASAAASPVAPSAAVSGGVSDISADAKARIDRVLAEHNLTDRERDILLGVFAGKTQAQLADELFLSRSTVGTYCTRAYEKLGVETKEQARELLSRIAAGGQA